MLIHALLQEQNEVQIEPGVHKLLTNYQTGGYKFRPISGWKEQSDLSRSFMNALAKSTQAHAQA